MSLGHLFIITVFIFMPLQSYSFRHLSDQTHVSPSPSPSSNNGSNIQEACSRASRSCQLKTITACFTYSQTETCVFVHNNGESLQHVKIMILPAKNLIKEINITSHQTMEVKISSEADLSSTIALTTGDGDCVISTAAAPPPENHYWKYSSYGTYVTPTNGAYLVIILLIIGGILTFIKLRARGRHLDGVPYHELEMENSTDVKMEENETENWDQDWDDQWDEDNFVSVKQADDLITKLPNSNGRKKEWDD